MNLTEEFDKIVAGVDEDQVRERIDDTKEEYIRDWEDEFDDIHEAYDEQGRGQAEDAAVGDVINSWCQGIDSDDYVALHSMLMEHWCL